MNETVDPEQLRAYLDWENSIEHGSACGPCKAEPDHCCAYKDCYELPATKELRMLLFCAFRAGAATKRTPA
jgi:hypothetical protein